MVIKTLRPIGISKTSISKPSLSSISYPSMLKVDVVPVDAGPDDPVGKGYKISENKQYGAVEPLYHVSNVLRLGRGPTEVMRSRVHILVPNAGETGKEEDCRGRS